MALDITNDIRKQQLVSTSNACVLYKGTQVLADGITREVNILYLKNPDLEETERQQRFHDTFSWLLELSEAGVIGEVFGQYDSEKHGAGIVYQQELETLASRIKKEPASPTLVKQVAGQVLQALRYLHESEDTPSLYSGVTPETICLLPNGIWGLSAPQILLGQTIWGNAEGFDAKYASPEMLDTEKGELGPASDLYSLGMVLYELALGETLFAEQFASVYHEGGMVRNKRKEQEKWLYWHVSEQLDLQPIHALLDNYPKELSDVIARMLHKDIQKRAAFASTLIEDLEWSGPQKDIVAAKPRKKKEPLLTPMALVLIFLILALATAGAAVYMNLKNRKEPRRIVLTEKMMRTHDAYVKIEGVVHAMPNNTKLVVVVERKLLKSRAVGIVDSKSGAFVVQMELPELGAYTGFCGIMNESGSVLFQSVFQIERLPPHDVRLILQTNPPAYAARVEVGYAKSERPNERTLRHALADQDGKVIMSVPYGDYVVRVSHPLYRFYYGSFFTGIDQTAEQTLGLSRVEQSVTIAMLKRLFAEYQFEKKSAPPDDPVALKRMADIQRTIVQLTPLQEGSLSQEDRYVLRRRATLYPQIRYLEELEPKTTEQENELKRLHEMMSSLSYTLSTPVQKERIRQLQKDEYELDALQAVEKPTDAQKDRIKALGEAIARTKEYLSDPANLSVAQLFEKRDVFLARIEQLNHLSDFTTAQAQDYARINAHLDQVNRIVSGIPAPVEPVATEQESDPTPSPTTVPSLAGQAEETSTNTAGMEHETPSGSEMALEPSLTPREKPTQDSASIGLEPDLIGQNDAQKELDLKALASKVQALLPAKAFQVALNPVDNKIDVTGAVLDNESLALVGKRIAPVFEHLIVDITVDPVFLIDGLQADIEKAGMQGVLVRSFLAEPNHRVYVGVPAKASEKDIEQIQSLCAAYISNPTYCVIYRFPLHPIGEPSAEEEERTSQLQEGLPAPNAPNSQDSQQDDASDE